MGYNENYTNHREQEHRAWFEDSVLGRRSAFRNELMMIFQFIHKDSIVESELNFLTFDQEEGNLEVKFNISGSG